MAADRRRSFAQSRQPEAKSSSRGIAGTRSPAAAAFPSDESLYEVEEGLGLLAGIVAEGGQGERAVARNAGLACVNGLASRIEAAIARRDVPEPELKRLMRAAQVLAASAFAEDAQTDLAALTVAVAGRYLDALFEGYSPEEKSREIERLKKRLQS